MRRLRHHALTALLLGPLTLAPAHAAPARPADTILAGCPRLQPPVVVPGGGDVQVAAMQYFQDVDAAATYSSILDSLDCYFRAYVDPYRQPGVPTVVAFNELTGLSFGLEGTRGTAARAFAHTPGASFFGQTTNQPVGAVGGAVGLVAAAYAAPVSYYASRYPAAVAQGLATSVATVTSGGVRVPLDLAFAALTDTYVRAAIGSFSTLARRHGVTVVAGAVLPVLDDPAACSKNGYPGWTACPGWTASTAPADVAALADPDLAASGQAGPVYVADVPTVQNAAYFFDPSGALYDVQPKVNLTAIEQEIGWRAAPPSTIHAVALREGDGHTVAGVSMGVAISLDAFEHGRAASPCADPASYVECLDGHGVNVLLQPEFNDGSPECSSWSDFSPSCGAPAWQQLGWMYSSWYDIEARLPGGGFLYPHLRYAVNPFMVGNLYDITGDGQSSIIARDDGRAEPGAYVGDRSAALYASPGADTPYADPVQPLPPPVGDSAALPQSLAQADGMQAGFLALAPWVLSSQAPADVVRDQAALPAGDAGSLESCEDGLVPGSQASSGPCGENAYRATALIASLRLVSSAPAATAAPGMAASGVLANTAADAAAGIETGIVALALAALCGARRRRGARRQSRGTPHGNRPTTMAPA